MTIRGSILRIQKLAGYRFVSSEEFHQTHPIHRSGAKSNCRLQCEAANHLWASSGYHDLSAALEYVRFGITQQRDVLLFQANQG
jgi:hypothetical protein